LAGECAPSIPVAVISNGTRPDQDCRIGTLGDITNRMEGIKPPAIVVIGEVVALWSKIEWMELAGKLQLE
jgi:siroheme synthase